MTATLLLAVFIIYLYVPFLLFKFFVEGSVDLSRLRDESRIGEFFGAALPSALLHAAAFTLLRVVAIADRWNIIRRPAMDWHVVASLLDPTFAALRARIAVGPAGEIQYLCALYLVAVIAGVTYGSIELKLITRRAARELFLRPGGTRRHAAWLAALLFRQLFARFVIERISPVFVWTATETWAFIRTKSDRLFFGRIYEYIKTADGDVDSIVLTNSQRYSRRTPAECLAAGRGPLTRLHGSIAIQWSEIADINLVESSVMSLIRRRYANDIMRQRRVKRR
jgi:hypothetical protein